MRFSFVDLLFPARCAACGALTQDARAICAPCFEAIPAERTLFCGECRARIPSASRICHPKFPCLMGAAASYDDPRIRALIAALKFKGIERAAEPLGELLAHYALQLPLTFDSFVIVPVPLSARRARTRGFNQSALIARVVGEHLHIPLAEHILVRTRHTKPQSELKGAALREKNVAGCFSAQSSSSPSGASILLIDDVVTSGATMREAARALKAAGARRVVALAAAKA